MSELNEALLGEEVLHRFDSFDGIDIRNAFRSDSQLERDKKIGAAGEVYVRCISIICLQGKILLRYGHAS